MEYVNKKIHDNKKCNIALTGGRSAKKLYETLSKNKEFLSQEGLFFYLSDERLVPLGDIDSNYSMIASHLFAECDIEKIFLYQMHTDHNNIKNSIRRYSLTLPEKIDLTILGLGDDGHIASIFPRSSAIWSPSKVVVTESLIEPKFRISLGARYLLKSEMIFMIGYGKNKIKIAKEAFTKINDIESMPCRLALHGKWMLT